MEIGRGGLLIVAFGSKKRKVLWRCMIDCIIYK